MDRSKAIDYVRGLITRLQLVGTTALYMPEDRRELKNVLKVLESDTPKCGVKLDEEKTT